MKLLNIDKASIKLDATQQKHVRKVAVVVEYFENWFSVKF